MVTARDIEQMAIDCKLNPLTCGFRGSYCRGMTPLCLKEWIKGDCYHPFCYNKSTYRVRIKSTESVVVDVSAYSEDDACDKAYSLWMLDIEPDMEIVKVE